MAGDLGTDLQRLSVSLLENFKVKPPSFRALWHVCCTLPHPWTPQPYRRPKSPGSSLPALAPGVAVGGAAAQPGRPQPRHLVRPAALLPPRARPPPPRPRQRAARPPNLPAALPLPGCHCQRRLSAAPAVLMQLQPDCWRHLHEQLMLAGSRQSAMPPPARRAASQRPAVRKGGNECGTRGESCLPAPMHTSRQEVVLDTTNIGFRACLQGTAGRRGHGEAAWCRCRAAGPEAEAEAAETGPAWHCVTR